MIVNRGHWQCCGLAALPRELHSEGCMATGDWRCGLAALPRELHYEGVPREQRVVAVWLRCPESYTPCAAKPLISRGLAVFMVREIPACAIKRVPIAADSSAAPYANARRTIRSARTACR